MKTVNGFKEFSCFTKYNRIGSQNINKQIVNIADKNLTDFSVGITILNQRIIYKDDIEFVTEFPCLLGHPVALNRHLSPTTYTADEKFLGWP